jgi:xanthine dehydrogenase accessory factor
VSGGCVEGAVVEVALEILGGADRRLETFGYSDDEAFAVGLTCGGTIHLFVEPFDGDELTEAWASALRADEPHAVATVVGGPGLGAKLLVRPGRPTLGSLGDADLDRVVTRDVEGELAAGTTGVRRYGPHGEARQDEVAVFVESFVPAPRMLIFGAVDFTGALVRIAKVLGYDVTVCDARPVFATKRRFPLADEVVVDWPHRLLEKVGPTLTARDAVCVLTHDHKFDVPAIVAALGTDAGYLGAMGSRRTHAERVARLREAGVDDDELARIRAPIGLDLGARTPEETAIAICGEIIATRTGRTAAKPLRDTEGAIHADR